MAIQKKIKKDVNYYLGLPWTYTIETTLETGKRLYIVHVNELPGVSADADTVEEAMCQIKEVMAQIFKMDLEDNIEILEPINIKDYKGQILYRTTPHRHYLIVREAKRKNISISQVLDTLVDSTQRK